METWLDSRNWVSLDSFADFNFLAEGRVFVTRALKDPMSDYLVYIGKQYCEEVDTRRKNRKGEPYKITYSVPHLSLVLCKPSTGETKGPEKKYFKFKVKDQFSIEHENFSKD